MKPEAIYLLNQALSDRWRLESKAGKLTREVRAELLGVSVVTMERLLSGGGVDRTTVRHAFNSLGLSWSDELLQPSGSSPEQPIVIVEPEQVEVIELAAETRPKLSVRQISVVALLASALVPIGLLSLATRTETLHRKSGDVAQSDASWRKDFNSILGDGTTRYNQGRYDEARVAIDQAVSIARTHRSADTLASALRMSGDLANSQGSLMQAKDCYTEALGLWKVLNNDVSKPAVEEALGDVETKLGEFDEARQDLMISLAGFRSSHEQAGVAMASRDLGSLCLEKHDPTQANQWFEQGLRAVQGLAQRDLDVDILGRQALAFRELGKLQQAEAQLTSCLKYWTSRGHPRWIAVSEFQLGTVEAKQHHTREALALIEHSKAQFSTLGDKWGAAQSDKWLSQLGNSSLD